MGLEITDPAQFYGWLGAIVGALTVLCLFKVWYRPGKAWTAWACGACVGACWLLFIAAAMVNAGTPK